MQMRSLSWGQIGLGVVALAVAAWMASGFFSGRASEVGAPQTQQAASPLDRGAARPQPSSPEAATPPQAVTAAGAQIEPALARAGDVAFTLTLSDARPMYDAAAFTDAPSTSSQGGSGAAKPPVGSAVLNNVRKATHNIDPSQKAPADPKGEGEMLRHVVLKVQRASSGETVPYLEVSFDLLRNGRPVLYDQPLLPMVAAGEDATSMYYGNNVAFPGKGVYQVFVRLRPNPFLGTEAPPAAQFNITFK